MIPRLFNVEYDLRPRMVCKKAGAFLQRHNFLRIQRENPQVALRADLKHFMIKRKQVRQAFDLIKCDTYTNIIERNGFAAEKNLILKDCYLTLQQLAELPEGLLMEKLKQLERCILDHLLSSEHLDTVLDAKPEQEFANTVSVPLNACKVCKVAKYRCEVCNGKNGPEWYEYEISVGSVCTRCGTKAHIQCLRDRHKCTYLQSKRQSDIRLLD